jgi:RES domain-containing protein
VFADEIEEQGVTWVGRPMELVRALDPVYLDEARLEFGQYLQKTLAASQRAGGRFNPPGEFGVLYTASDEDTAWEEIGARYKREGVPGLPPRMGMIGLLVLSGRYADFTDDGVARSWGVDPQDLSASTPTDAQREACWTVGRAARAVADFLQTRSARAGGANVPLFPDREQSELRYELQYLSERPPPDHLRQTPAERW